MMIGKLVFNFWVLKYWLLNILKFYLNNQVIGLFLFIKT